MKKSKSVERRFNVPTTYHRAHDIELELDELLVSFAKSSKRNFTLNNEEAINFKVPYFS